MQTIQIAGFSLHTPDAAWVDQAGAEINRNGLCLLRNRRNILPLKPERCRKILIVDVTDENRRRSSELLKDELERRGFQAVVMRDIYDVPSNVCWQEDIDALQNQYDIAIFNMDMAYATAWNVPFMLVWAMHMFDGRKKIVLNYGSPFFADTYLPEEATYIEVNADACEATVSAITDRLFGEAPWCGRSILHTEPAIALDEPCGSRE